MAESKAAREDILEIRHSSLYAPRDFDISPYFKLVKPTIEKGFDYRKMNWADQRAAAPANGISDFTDDPEQAPAMKEATV
mgnify:FL=1